MFQEVVAIVHAHMSKDAEVEESALLTHDVTGDSREVDVVIRSAVAGYDVIVSVEASARRRKADATWVEAMIEKHRHLPTSKLVLVSQAGFTEAARVQAAAAHVATLAPEDLDVDDPDSAVIDALPSLWPKILTLTPERAHAKVRTPTGALWALREMAPDTLLFVSGSRLLGSLVEVFKHVCDKNFRRVAELIGLADIEDDIDRYFTLGLGPEFEIDIDGETTGVYLRWDEADPAEMHMLEAIEFIGRAAIRVGEVPLVHRRLGEVSYAYGEGMVGGQSVLLVGSRSADVDECVTVRVRPHSPE